MTKRVGILIIKNIFVRLDMCSLYVAQAVRCCPIPLEPRVRVFVDPCGLGGWNQVCVGFLGVSLVFPYHKFHSTIFPHSSHSFRFIPPCDGASGVIWRHPCYSETFIASHPSTRLCVGHELRIYSAYSKILSTGSHIIVYYYNYYYYAISKKRDLSSFIVKVLGQVAQAVRRLAMGWTVQVRSRVSEEWRFFFTPSCPDWPWGPLNLL